MFSYQTLHISKARQHIKNVIDKTWHIRLCRSYNRYFMHFRTRTIDHSNRSCFVPDRHTDLDHYCARSQKPQTAGRHVNQLKHIILTCRYSFPLNTVCFGEKQWLQNLRYFGVTKQGIQPTISFTHGELATLRPPRREISDWMGQLTCDHYHHIWIKKDM